MVNKLSSLCVQRLLDENIIEFDSMEKYLYLFKLLIGGLLKGIGFCLIGIIFNIVLELLIFLIGFYSLRLSVGGFRVDSYLKYFIYTLCFSLIGINLAIIGSDYLGVCFLSISCLIGVILIFIKAPIENRPLTSKEKIIYKKLVGYIL